MNTRRTRLSIRCTIPADSTIMGNKGRLRAAFVIVAETARNLWLISFHRHNTSRMWTQSFWTVYSTKRGNLR